MAAALFSASLPTLHPDAASEPPALKAGGRCHSTATPLGAEHSEFFSRSKGGAFLNTRSVSNHWARKAHSRFLRGFVRCSGNGSLGRENKVSNLVDGRAVEGPDLSVTVNGLKLPNPYVIASGPPGTNYSVMKRAFKEGWGGVICKTLSLDSSKVINVIPRYARMKAQETQEIIGWQNIELISDRPFNTMLSELKRLKEEFPDRILIGSIMEEYNKNAWEEIIGRVEETGVDALEINFSCPHGMPERRMGMAMGQDCELLAEVCGWINDAAKVPVWAKMTPNITDITQPARAAIANGCEGVSAINTITSVMGINLETLRPEPCVEGYTTPGGYSSKAVRPIALAKVMAISKLINEEFSPDVSISGIGGIDNGGNAAEFILLGSNTVQVCTGVMIHGYGVIHRLCSELQDFMIKHNFQSIEEFRGASLNYFTTHTHLVELQKEAAEKKRAIKKGILSDKDWTGEGFVTETETMVSN